jgi:hypothetical protein
MAKKRSYLVKAGKKISLLDSILSLAQWLWDKTKGYIVPAFGGGVMYYLAAATQWLDAWGPIAWGAIGVGTFALLAVVHGWWVGRNAKARLRNVQADIAERAGDTN